MCALSSGSCTVKYTESDAGTPTITATYSGDSNNAGSLPPTLYYTATTATNTFYRSSAPIVSSPVTETLNGDGSVTLNIASGDRSYADAGFYYNAGTLDALAKDGVTISGTGSMSANLWINPQDWIWADNTWTSLGTDGAYALGGTLSGTKIINGTYDFYITSAVAGSCLNNLVGQTISVSTIALACGASTPIDIWVGIDSTNAAASATVSGASSTTVTVSPATTPTTSSSAACHFNLSFYSPSQFYLSLPSMTFHYTASTAGSCTPSAPFSGYVELYRNGALSSFETMRVAVTPLQAGETSGTISINSANLTPASYTAQFYLSSANYKSTTSTSFYIIKPADLLITNFTVQPSNVTLGSGISFIQDVSNLGGLSSTNTTLNIAVSGPGNFYDVVHQKLGDIGKNNAQTVITQLAGDSVVAGVYTINENVSFTSNLTAGGITYSAGTLLSNTQKGSYAVYYNASSAYNASIGLPTPPSNIGALSISSMPIYARVLIGNTTTNYLGLTDTENLTVGVRIIVPNVPYGKITTSIKSFLVNEGTSEYVQFVFTPYLNATPGVYAVPILISTNGHGIITNGTVYLIFDIEKKTPSVASFDMAEESTNYGKNLGVSLNVYNPTHSALNNTVMSVKFSSFAAPIGDILLTGAQANKATSGGDTSLEWFIPSIQPGHSAQIGYSVSNITDLQLLLGPSINLASTSGSTAPTFTLINMAPINLTLGENASLTVSGLYQGAYQSSMTLRLSSPLAHVANPVQVVPDVMQSQIISTSFMIVPTIVGNTTLSFSVNGQGINETYYIPIVVSTKSTALTRSVQTVEKNLLLIIATAIAILMLIIALQVATEELPKSIRIEEGTEATSNTEMRELKYDHVFELLSKEVEEKETRMRIKLKGIPTKWGIFTPLNKRNVRIINDSGHLTIYARGPVADKIKTYLRSNKLAFVELEVD